jgi:hypothetical protein
LNPQDLAAHKSVRKLMVGMPRFKKLARKSLPKPFNRIGREGSQCTELITVSDDHRAMFIWHDGPLRTDRSFYGYLLFVARNGDLRPLFELHYHPNHKGLHCKLPCRTRSNYTNRLLPGAPELSLKLVRDFDPRSEYDRNELIDIFCKAVGVEMAKEIDTQGELELWN